jgi:hypothetical protein
LVKKIILKVDEFINLAIKIKDNIFENNGLPILDMKR